MHTSTYTLPMPFKQAWKWAAFVALLFFLNYAARTTLSPLLVSLEQDLGVGHAQATSLLLLQGLGFAAAQAVSGFLVGIVRPARVASLCLVASGACLMCMPLANTLNEARGVFFVFGLTVGLYFPAGMATLGSLVKPADWGKAVGIHELAPNLNFIVVPLVAQTALLFTDWRGVFALVGASMLLTGLAFLRWGRGGEHPAAPPSFKGSAAILRRPATWVIALLLAITMSGEFAVFSVLQLYLVNEGGFSPEHANLILSLSRLATPLAVIGGGWAADALRPVPVLRLCLLAHALGLGLMAIRHETPALIGACIQALSIAFAFPPLFKAISGCFPLRRQPVLFSLTMPTAALVSAGGMPWFFGLCGEYASFGIGFAALGVISALSALTLSLLRPRADQAPFHQ